MDDMQAIEQRVTRELLRRAGPSEPVNDAAIFTAITTTQSPKWRFQSMVSATKFFVAGAIVALFGGFLLAGVLTQPSEQTAPAAATESPSLRTTEELLSSLTTEEVEPGVERIVSDGVRDLSRGQPRPFGPPDGLAAAPDGTVWLLTGQTVMRLGEPDTLPAPFADWSDLKVSSDGSLWGRTDTSSIGRLDGDGWTTVAELDSSMDSNAYWDLAPDGTVWTGRSQARVSRLDESGWQDHPIDLDSFDLDLQALGEAYGPGTFGPYFEDLRVDANGDVWAALSVNNGAFASMILLRYDGETWSVEDPLGLGGYYAVYPIGVGSDGTVWVHLQAGRDASNEPEGHYLARLADDRWTVFSEDDGVGQLVWRAESHGLVRVDHDGAVWVAPQDERSPGVRAFDGKAWRQYLDGHDAIDMEIAPDGSVWVLTAHDLYRITPAAAADVEADDTATTPDLLPGVDLVTEEVEPGVYRVLSDGHRALADRSEQFSCEDSYVFDGTWAGGDGAVWFSRCSDLFRLGEAASLAFPSGMGPGLSADVAIAPDGVLWVAEAMPAAGLWSFDGSRWLQVDEFADRFVRGVEVTPDGTVWVLWCPDTNPNDFETCKERTRVSRSGEDGWAEVARPAGHAMPTGGYSAVHHFAVGPDRQPWISSHRSGLLRYDGGEWTVVDPAGAAPYQADAIIDVGLDGAVWAYQRSIATGEAYLSRLADGAWTVFGEADGVPPEPWGLLGGFEGFIRATPDGSVWLTKPRDGGYGRLLHFDGSTWTEPLEGRSPSSIAIATDGSAWVEGWTGSETSLYVITPEAVAE